MTFITDSDDDNDNDNDYNSADHNVHDGLLCYDHDYKLVSGHDHSDFYPNPDFDFELSCHDNSCDHSAR